MMKGMFVRVCVGGVGGGGEAGSNATGATSYLSTFILNSSLTPTYKI